MDLNRFFAAELDRHEQALAAIRKDLAEPFGQLVKAAVAAVRGGHKIVLFGNGGSAADAQHLATELTVRYVKDRPPIPAIALTTDTSALTAIGNDLGFDHLFSRQVEALCVPGDLVIGISTSGNSPNVLLALAAAKAKGCVVAGFSGREGGKMVGQADPLLTVPVAETARIQEMHILIGHAFCAALEQELDLV